MCNLFQLQDSACTSLVFDRVPCSANRRLLVTLAVLGLLTITARGQLPQVLYLPFDEGSGVATADIALPGQSSTNAILTNASSWNVVDPYLGNAAWKPNAGVLDVVNLGTIYATAGSFTFEFALNPQPTTVVGAMEVLTEGSQFILSLKEGLQGEFRFRLASSPTVVQDFGPPIPLNKWTFVSIAYDSMLNLLFLYYDAVLVDVAFPVSAAGFPILPISSAGPWQIGVPTPWIGSIDEFRVWNVARSPALIRMASKVELANGIIDVGAGEITAPPRRLGRCQYYSTAETLSVTVCNPGLTTIFAGSAIPMTVSVDGSVVVTESLVLANDLNPGESVPYTFLATIDLQQEGLHTVRVTSNFPGDTQPGNDVLELDFRGGGPGVVSEFPWREDFDGDFFPFLAPASTIVPPVGWNQRQGELNPLGVEEEWFFVRAPQLGGPSSIFPNTDHTSHSDVGVYANMDTGAPQRSIESPCIELFGLVNPTLAFYYNRERLGSVGLASAHLEVKIHSLTTGTTTTIFLLTFNAGPDVWRLLRVDLSPWINQTIVMYFEGIGGNNNTISIDDVSIFEESTSLPGQAPQLLLATFDVNGATNANLQEITSGENGPYETSNFAPAVLNFSFEGLPLQPVLLLSGDLSPQNATYPGIGQMDMGGPLDPVTGIPTALTIWGDGFAPLTNLDFLFFTDATGLLSLQATMPPFNLPPFPQPLIHRMPFATFQAVMGMPTAPFVLLSNAVELLQW